MASIPELTPGEITVIITVFTAVSGFVWRVFAWVQKKGAQLVDFVQPKLEAFAESHNRLLDTLGSKQVETTAHISAIRETIDDVHDKIDCVSQTLTNHGHSLEKLENRTCQHPTGPAEKTHKSGKL